MGILFSLYVMEYWRIYTLEDKLFLTNLKWPDVTAPTNTPKKLFSLMSGTEFVETLSKVQDQIYYHQYGRKLGFLLTPKMKRVSGWKVTDLIKLTTAKLRHRSYGIPNYMETRFICGTEKFYDIQIRKEPDLDIFKAIKEHTEAQEEFYLAKPVKWALYFYLATLKEEGVFLM